MTCVYQPKRILQHEQFEGIEVVVYVKGGIARDRQSLCVSISDDLGIITVARLTGMESYGRSSRSEVFESVRREGVDIALTYARSPVPGGEKTVRVPWTWIPTRSSE